MEDKCTCIFCDAFDDKHIICQRCGKNIYKEIVEE